MSKVKWNYAVMKPLMGDVWIGKTKLKCDGQKIFKKLETAKYHAKDLFCENNPDFDEDSEIDEDNDSLQSIETQEAYQDIENSTENNVEEIKKGMEKFIA